MAKVLVLGASSRLGQFLVPSVSNHGHQVVRHGFQNGGDVSADLTRADEVARLLGEVEPDTIINLVAMTDVDECQRRPDQAFLLNTRVVENVAQWVARNGATRLIHLSTDQVYSGDDGPQTESKACPLNVYGITKYCGELAAAAVNGTVLRTNYFGAGSNARPGLSDWLIEGFTRGEALRLFVDIQFSPLHVDKLVELVSLVATRPVPGVFNLGSTDGMTKRDFGIALAAHLGLDPSRAIDATSHDVPGRAPRPRDMRLDSSLFARTYNCSLPTLAEEIARLHL